MASNNKRRLLAIADAAKAERLLSKACYRGSSKHKMQPALYGLTPFRGHRGDATLCDKHAEFGPAQMGSIKQLLDRGIKARLVGGKRMMWTVADNGWIFEGRLTNVEKMEYHGYPLRASETIAKLVYRRFRDWAGKSGSPVEKQAVTHCKARYGFE